MTASRPRANPDMLAALSAFSGAQAKALSSLREILARLLPGATETIAWGMPTVKIGPDQVVSYSGFARHNSIFPGAEVAAAIAAEYPELTTTKGTVHLPRDRAPAVALVRRIVRLRIEQINDSYPRAKGTTRSYYDNGFTEYIGTIKDGRMHGAWEWFRRDGTLKRSGRFTAGEAVGTWTTYDSEGNPYKVTEK